MHCPNCGVEIDNDWKFCRSCGASLADPSPESVSVASRATADVTTAPEAVPGEFTEVRTAEESQAVLPVAASVAATPSLPTSPTATDRLQPREHRRFRPRRGTFVAAGVVALLLAIAGLGITLLNTQSDLTAVRTTLGETEGHLAAAEASLEERDTEIQELNTTISSQAGELEDADRALTSNEEERLALSTELGQTRQELDALDESLAETQGDLQTQQQRTSLQAGQIGILKTCLSGVSDALYWAAYDYWATAASTLQSVSGACDQADALFN